MKTIYKYVLPIEDSFTLAVLKGAEIINFANQRETPVLWAVVDTNEATTHENRSFALVGTGNPFPNAFGKWKYINTAQFFNGELVLHLFEEEGDKVSVPNMIRIALKEQFSDGATLAQLHAYFIERWGRNLSKAGVSVQLSRMKEDGEVDHESDVWITKPFL